MPSVYIDASAAVGTIKPMHAVNNGPLRTARATQIRENFTAYKAAHIPFARNHDASMCSSYGGPHTVDVHLIFPDFSRDADDPDAYDFVNTDLYLTTIADAGTEVFYRLGSAIEHTKAKYGTQVPADFKKWAAVCEHIIAHYNEGWANGFNMNITYWEIWNEPNLDADDSTNKRNWQGTSEEFFELFKITAIHLKNRFPYIKIGGPGSALTGLTNEWLERFFTYLTDGERAPLDFFSWHIYAIEPDQVTEWSNTYRRLLDRFGYTEAESILDEWNYCDDWGIGFIDSIQDIIGIKGAAFTAAVMCRSQNDPVDMLMYYDARPSVFNGMFDMYTLRPLKGYYPFVMFSRLYEAKNQLKTSSDCPQIYAVSAKDSEGELSAMLSYYAYEKGLPEKDVAINIENGNGKEFYCYVVDDERTFEFIGKKNAEELNFKMKHQSILFVSQTPVELVLSKAEGDTARGFNC